MKFKLISAVIIILLWSLNSRATTRGCMTTQYDYSGKSFFYSVPYTGPLCSGSNCFQSNTYLANRSCFTSITSEQCTIIYQGNRYYGVIATHEGTQDDVTGNVCNTDIDSYAGILLGAVSITSVFFFNRRNRKEKIEKPRRRHQLL